MRALTYREEGRKPEMRFPSVFIVAALAFFIGLGIGLRGTQAEGSSVASDRGMDASASSTDRSFVGRVFGIGAAAPIEIGKGDVDFEQFWNVWRDIKENYYNQPVEDKKLLYGAIQGLADSVGDPYTMYFTPAEAKDFADSMKGEFSGIGAEIGMKNGELQIVAPLPDSPAERSGLLARDLILQINGEESLAMPVEMAVSKIRGPKGTNVTLMIGRPAVPEQKDSRGNTVFETLEITVTRDIITVKSAHLKDIGNGIYLIDIRSFNDDAADTFRDLVDEALGKGAKAFVIDVRNDPGGFLDRSIQIAGSWLNGDIVVMQRRQGRIVESLVGEGDGRLRGIPTVVLVNEGSASAAEILAGALQDYGAATVVGMKTFGKGSVQHLIEYEDGSSMKITISEWLTPKGRSIEKEGIQPDREVHITPEDNNADRDAQLDEAVEILTEAVDRSS